jgi:hypothetical protein
MDIYPVQNGPVPINAHSIPSVRREGIGRKILQEIDVLPEKEFSSRNHPELLELQKINDSWNEIAQKKRTYDNTLNEVQDYIARMKTQLERIIKNFPPFPPGSEERVQVLRNFAAFRKLIDQLTIPPPEESRVGAENSATLSPADSIPNPM